MNEFIITQAQPEDVPALLHVLNEGMARKHEQYNDNSWGNASWVPEDLVYYGEETFYIGRLQGLAVATLSLEWEGGPAWDSYPGHAGYACRMAVNRSHQGQGLGARMIEWAAGQVAESGRELIRLDCDARNSNLCQHYQALGFVLLGSGPASTTADRDYIPALFERPIALDRPAVDSH